ncbi:hypothetical protein SLEP1_g1257 [Rubroshorea leprosula]|uniref:Uncharacterized protein n=1 Tax=Rubroshorea leprosula TaxID=152421 RepID=A0AAV5HD97_9ROSI|nr:hypothetical protein SLEP1_g1257 [Rubroshorea leprosula]
MGSSRVVPSPTTSTIVSPHIRLTDITVPQQQGNAPALAQQLVAPMTQLLPQSNPGMIPEMRQPPVVPSPITQKDVTLTIKNQPTMHSYMPNFQVAAGPSLQFETITNVKSSPPVTMAPTAAEKLHTPFSLPAYVSRSQTQSQLQSQPSLTSDPLFTHAYSSRVPLGNIDAVTDLWRARQGLASTPYSQANQNNYNTSLGGPVQPQLEPGPPLEGNEFVSNKGFESWSPDKSSTRSPGYVPRRNLGPGTNPRWGYRPDNSWQQGSSEYWDHNRQGNRRWRDRRR